MAELRIRKMDEEIHSKLKIKAIKQKTSLENLVRKILAEAVEE